MKTKTRQRDVVGDYRFESLNRDDPCAGHIRHRIRDDVQHLAVMVS
jgi:hypothetical protein